MDLKVKNRIDRRIQMFSSQDFNETISFHKFKCSIICQICLLNQQYLGHSFEFRVVNFLILIEMHPQSVAILVLEIIHFNNIVRR